MPDFIWGLHRDTEQLIDEWIIKILERMFTARAFIEKLLKTTSTKTIDWVDYITIRGNNDSEILEKAGYVQEIIKVKEGYIIFKHPDSKFPRIILELEKGDIFMPRELALKCESVVAVLNANGFYRKIEGSAYSPFRRSVLFDDSECRLIAIERCCFDSYSPVEIEPRQATKMVDAYELWATRERFFADDPEGMKKTLDTAIIMVDMIGKVRASTLAFQAERRYWESRNRTASIQGMRQRKMGFGWGNHDHHTYRSSRNNFNLLIKILETFGFECRERFYAGEEAGWGAQVMENSSNGLVVFADVDLTPEEVEGDFSHTPLKDMNELGTVGLWVALHGESMLGAGLHHLASLHSFDRLAEDLKSEYCDFMAAFSEFDFLKQAFSVGPVWNVEEGRINDLRQSGLITEEQAGEFRAKGALGSHLENIERRSGFKGFNQESVNIIIKATDPRKQN